MDDQQTRDRGDMHAVVADRAMPGESFYEYTVQFTGATPDDRCGQRLTAPPTPATQRWA